MKHMLSRDIALTVLVASLALAGCKGKDNVAVADTTSASTMAMPDSAKMNAASGAMAASLSDANIAGLIDEVNVADSTLAAAALPKLTNSGARSFARLMMGEHHALHVKGLALEKEQKITPEVPAADPFKGAVGAEQSALAPLPKGAAYDSTYMANEVGIHRAVIEWQGKNVPQNPALQGYMKDAKGIYQKHLDEGLSVQTKLSGGPSS
jgi:predicted outer membrane protein